jgi:hypothetical protein
MSDLFKIEIDKAVQRIHFVMREIELADKEYEVEENPDRAALISNFILERGKIFNDLADELEKNLNRYINELSRQNKPIPLSYSRLLREIRKT